MEKIIPTYESFDVHGEGNVAKRWEKWLKRLENLFVAASIDSSARQKALMLHYAGQEVYDIYETLSDRGTTYASAKDKLTGYFKPKKNIEYETYIFRNTKQETGETIDTYTTRLRQLAVNCEFTEPDKEIRSQIIQSCCSKRLRRKALRTPDMTLKSLLDEARALKISEKHSRSIEEGVNMMRLELFVKPKHKVHNPNSKHDRPSSKIKKNTQCYKCGGNWPHDGTCPASSRKCMKCRKIGYYAAMCRDGSKPKIQPSKFKKRKRKTSKIIFIF